MASRKWINDPYVLSLTINSVFGLYLYFSLIFIIVNGIYTIMYLSPQLKCELPGDSIVFTSLCSLVSRIQPKIWDTIKEREKADFDKEEGDLYWDWDLAGVDTENWK